MKLRRLYLSQFKQFAEPFELDNLQDGLVIVSGDNEAGKSTLSLALRSAFFERHNTSTVDSFRPYGDSSARPEVHVEFDLQGKSALLKKRFLRQAGCDLRVGTENFDGSLAETYLAERLGFTLRKRGGSTAADWGVPGLLWVQQGELHFLNQAVAPATNQLGDALGASMGALVSSDSDEVLSEVENRLSELVTATGKPRAEYDKSLKQEQELADQVAKLRQEADSHKDLVNHFEGVHERFQHAQQERAWLTLRGRIPALQNEMEQAEQRDATLSRLTTELRSLEQEKEYVSSSLQNIQSEALRYETLQQTIAQLDETVEQGRVALADAETKHVLAQRTLQQAQSKRQAATTYEQWQVQDRERAQITQRYEPLCQVLSSAQALYDQQQQLRLHRLGPRIDTDALKQLMEMNQRCARLEAQLEVVSTRLRFDVQDTNSIRIKGKSLSDDALDVQISEPTTVDIEGVGAIHITPGGQDVITITTQLQSVKQQFEALLKQYEVSDLAHAETQHRVQEKQKLELERTNELLALKAPHGIAALESELADLKQRIDQKPTTAPELEDRPLSVAEAQALEQEAQAAQQRCERLWQEARQSWLELNVRRNSLSDEQQRLAAYLHGEEGSALQRRHQERFDHVSSKIASTQTEIFALESAKRGLRTASTINAEIDNLERRAAQAQRSFDDLKLELSRVETELQIGGARGLDEQLLLKQAALVHTSKRVQQFEQRVETLTHLKQLLLSSRAQLRERLQAPLLKRVQYYLDFLFPNSRIELAEDFVPKILHREDKQSSDVLDLSFGAVEQIAIIARLAYADLLKEAGLPTLIVLDDVLAYSDRQRLDCMKAALFDASSRHQIILFTCQPLVWSDAGGQIINLEQRKLARLS